MANSIERTGKIFMGTTEKNVPLDDNLLLENAIKRRNEETEVKKAGELFIEARKAKQAEIEAKLETLEMLSVGPKVIILPYAENPYTKLVSDSGLLMPTTMDFKNPETGEIEKPQNGIMCAKVIEIGPEVKYLRVGDDIYYDDRTAVPIPFFMQGYKVIAEGNALTVINEGLRERYNMK